MIKENAKNLTANQQRAPKVRIILGHKLSILNAFRAASDLGTKQIKKSNAF
jgi:hypothetical protein